MEISLERIAELERANYAATLPSAQITPTMEVVLREDLVLTSSQAFPAPDTNHACLLRATPRSADELIGEVKDYFQSRGLPVAVYVSPVCTPHDLETRLKRSGFESMKEEEAWLVLNDLPDFDLPTPHPGVSVRVITEDKAMPFAQIFLAAFGWPMSVAPAMAHLLRPSITLPNVNHYLASCEHQPVGTCSLLRHGTFGVLGSVGVLQDHRRSGAATNLVVEALHQAQEDGIETVMLQTVAGTPLERLLRISGFTTAFTRSCYVLSDASSDQN